VVTLFIKTTKAKDFEYIKLVESYREDGKTKHRVLFNFGRADLIKKDASFIRIVKRLCEIAEIPIGTNRKLLPDDCGEATLYNYGYLAYLRLWKQLGIETTLDDCQSASKVEYSIPNTVFLMAL